MASSNGYMTEFEPETESAFGYEQEQEFPGYLETEGERVFDEADELDLASRLLEVTDEAELDQFIGSLVKRVGRAAGRFVRSDVGRALGGVLKGAARQALPIVGTAIGGPAGGALASQAGKMFGLELEGLSPEDQEMETARQFVRFAGEAAKNAAQAAPQVPPQAAAQAAVVAAARQHAPGLLRPTGRPLPIGAKKRRGQWVRSGRNIILINC